MRVMVADVGSALATLAFGVLLFVAVGIVCVFLLGLMAVVLPRSARRDAPVVDVVNEDGEMPTAVQSGADAEELEVDGVVETPSPASPQDVG